MVHHIPCCRLYAPDTHGDTLNVTVTENEINFQLLRFSEDLNSSHVPIVDIQLFSNYLLQFKEYPM